MIDFDYTKYCYGCGACVDACPVSAITMRLDKCGFCFPKIEKAKCLNCGRCDSVCPHLNIKSFDNVSRVLYSAKHKDENIRLTGSSGSVFYALAKSHIDMNNGLVVAAGFDSELQLRHQIVNSIQDVVPLMKSKYIQSSTIGIFKTIKSLLNDDMSVLFVGTPCQCQALINFVPEQQRGRLTVVDFVCHGVPSQDLFNRCINRYKKQHNCRVIDVSFREKDGERMRTFLIRSIDNITGQEITWRGEPSEWSYYNGFLDHTTFRPSCFKCQFKSINRSSDLTLGDFWGLESINPDIKDVNDGYSMVVVNSKRGEELLDRISQEVETAKYPLKVAVDYNYAYAKNDDQSSLSCHFLKWYSYLPISIVDDLFLSSSLSLPWRILRKLLRYI